MIKLHNRIFRRILKEHLTLRRQLARLKYRLVGQIKLHPGCIIEPKAELKLSHSSSLEYVIEVGKATTVKDQALLYPRTGFIKVGENCSINPNCILLGYGGITIGNKVRIAANTSIVAFSHVFSDSTASIIDQGNICKGILIEDDVWIGTGVRILDGVTVGKGSIIGAGSVVNKSIPAYSVAVGVPAKVIRSRAS